MKLNAKNIILFLILLIVCGIAYKTVETSEKTDGLYLHIDTLLQHRAHLDTMYWDHLNQCAFEEKNPLPFTK